jgi:DNA-binding transcriptional regulator WhiA
MGQKSSVEKLPKNLREKLLEMLNDPACTQAWIAEAINDEAGEAVLSKSGVNRCAQRMKKFAEKNRQAVANPTGLLLEFRYAKLHDWSQPHGNVS